MIDESMVFTDDKFAAISDEISKRILLMDLMEKLLMMETWYYLKLMFFTQFIHST